jgi:AraC family transcriptional regulator
MTTGTGELCLAQEDGTLPTTLAAGSAPGESGVSIHCVRFRGGVHLRGTLHRHLVCFQSAQARFDCRIGDRCLRHDPPAGSLAICPAGVDCAADAKGGLDAILVTIDPRHLALAATEESAPDAQLMERLSGSDQLLLQLARKLALESADGYPNGPLVWNEVASGFIDGLLARHMSGFAPPRGALGKHSLAHLKDYIVAHINEPIQVAELAKLTGRSQFHFTRIFARTVGITPHRYIVHLRLQRAIELLRSGQGSLAEIAARTGFADQSHLSRWVRRVHGVSLTQLAP